MNEKMNVRQTVCLSLALIANAMLVLMEVRAFSLLDLSSMTALDLFKFYTNDSNIFTGITSAVFCLFAIASLISGKYLIPKWMQIIRLISAVCLYITFIVCASVLMPAYAGGNFSLDLFMGPLFYLHFMCPVVSVLSYILFEGQIKNRIFVYSIIGIIPTWVYTAILVVLNFKGIVYGPYPFLEVTTNPPLVSLLWAVTLLPGGYLVSLCGTALQNLFGRLQRM
ncbi:MAG: hypothetical protein MJ129_02595 [Clostridia bacterium]|nr:hypothetical protein [Clostridia bacterium]